MRGGIEALTNINKMKNEEEFSLDWKTAVIYPTYKRKGNRQQPGEYTGISLLSACGKIFSGIPAGTKRLDIT
jgi:hypothetical protein